MSKQKIICVHNMFWACSFHVTYWSGKSMNTEPEPMSSPINYPAYFQPMISQLWFSAALLSYARKLEISVDEQNLIVPSYTVRRTGISLSEALIYASTNPQYDDRLFIELQVQYRKISSSNLGRTWCVQKLFLTFRTIFVHNMFSPCSEKRRASDKDLPV
jgi:hypothetical protein